MRGSWVVLTAAVATQPLGGCDTVFGLGDPQPCEARSFDGATPNAITPADNFSISRDQSFAVLQLTGVMYQASPIDAAPVAIDLGVYMAATFALAAEGTSLLYTVSVEPPRLYGALRGSATTWRLDAVVPVGIYAGTPSAEEYGPRRVLVKMHTQGSTVQEYEDDNGVWTPLGDPHDDDSGTFAPNLTPNGLTLVYAIQHTLEDGTVDGGVYIQTRPSRDTWFGAPTQILAGNHRTPQLLDTCRKLYTIDPGDPISTQAKGELERYDLPD